jgi:hypothetical protein
MRPLHVEEREKGKRKKKKKKEKQFRTRSSARGGTATPQHINSQARTAATGYTPGMRLPSSLLSPSPSPPPSTHPPAAAIPPFVFIKSYYRPCKNFNARARERAAPGNLLEPTGTRRHYNAK